MGWQSTAPSRGTSLCVCICCTVNLTFVCVLCCMFVRLFHKLSLIVHCSYSAHSCKVPPNTTHSVHIHMCTLTDHSALTDIQILTFILYVLTHARTRARAHMHRHIYVPLTCQYHTSKLVSVRCKDVFSVGRLIIALLCVVCMCLVVCGMS